MADRDTKIKESALSGKLVSGDDPAMIGENFRQLTNMKYTDTHPIGIRGMTKINTTALSTHPVIKSGFHLNKDLPSESHVVVQAFNSGETEANYYTNETAIPSAGDFTATSLMTQGSSPSTANWSDAPGGNLVMCDGKGSYVYGGNEIKVGSFINYDPDNSFWYNYTERLQNNISTGSANIAILSRITEGTAADANTMLLLHLNNNVTDNSPTTAHTVKNYTRSDGSIGSDHCTTLTGWNDEDSVNGETTQESFGGYECFRLDTNTPAAVNNYAKVTKDFGAIGDSVFYASIRMYNTALGASADDDMFHFEVETGNMILYCLFATDGLFIRLAAGTYTEVGTDIVDIGAWNEWTFIVDSTTPADSTVDVYKNGVLQAAGVACDYQPGGTTDGKVHLEQEGATTTNRISYVDWIKIGAGSTAVTFSTTKVFGSHSAVFDGTADWLEIDDNADFDFSGGTFTIDGRFRVDTLTTDNPIWYQQIDLVGAAEDYFYFYIDTNGAVKLSIYDDGAETVALSTANGVIAVDTWYHLELVESSSNWFLYVDGILKTATPDASRAENYTSSVLIGRNDGATPVYYDGYMDEYRASNTARHLGGNFSLAVAEYASADYRTYGYIGSPRPLSGVKPYISTANTTAGTLAFELWDGSDWSGVSGLVDGTATVGVPFAKTGTISFTSTDGTAKVSVLDGIVLYWYRFYVTEMDATTAIYYVTLKTPMQTIKDTWDGIERPELSFKQWVASSSSYKDFTTNVFDDQYIDGETYTYAELDSMTTSDFFEVGFFEKQLGITFKFIPGKENSTANTVATIYYWSGSTYVTVGVINDGTAESAVSFAKNGTISWNPTADGAEFKKQIGNEVPLYYYKIVFSQALDAEVELYYVSGTPAPKTIPAYGYPILAGDSVWLLNELNGKRNRVLRSVPSQADTWNGGLALDFTVGSDKDLISGAAIYMQIGNNIYEVLVVCKRDETWMIIPSGDLLQKFLVDARRGCTASGTMKTASLSAKDALGTKRNVVIWQSDNAIVLYGGGSVIDVSGDISDYFDRTKSYAINRSYIGSSQSFFDEHNHYHWCFASGTSTTLNKELVYDTDRDRWYDIDRGSGKYLQCGIEIEDTSGNKYSYGGISQYMERLENGTDFDGNDIAHTLWIANVPIAETIAHQTQVKAVGMTCLATNTTTNLIQGNYYRDGKSATDMAFTLVPQNTGHTLATPTTQDISIPGNSIFHGFKFQMTTNNETIGFEPMYLYIAYKITRMKLLGGS